MKRDALRSLAACACAALLALASAARAVDGVSEINHASVLAAGGYPAAIGAPGSYVLTSNLTPPAGSDGIEVLAANVTLDLGGFQIVGTGAGTGIDGSAATGLTVRNGSVSGFTGNGILAGTGSHILQVKATSNSAVGISGEECVIVESTANGNGIGIAASHCKIENNIVRNNLVNGIQGTDDVIVHNQIEGNSQNGILTGGSTIQENVISTNGSAGITDLLVPGPFPLPISIEGANIRGNQIVGNATGVGMLIPSVISDNSVSGNTQGGIFCFSACAVRGNLVAGNNTSALAGGGGVSVGAGSSVDSNTISNNTGFGLTLPVTSGYSQNTLNANGALDVVAVPAGPHPTSGESNLCSGVPGPAATCP